MSQLLTSAERRAASMLQPLSAAKHPRGVSHLTLLASAKLSGSGVKSCGRSNGVLKFMEPLRLPPWTKLLVVRKRAWANGGHPAFLLEFGLYPMSSPNQQWTTNSICSDSVVPFTKLIFYFNVPNKGNVQIAPKQGPWSTLLEPLRRRLVLG